MSYFGHGYYAREYYRPLTVPYSIEASVSGEAPVCLPELKEYLSMQHIDYDDAFLGRLLSATVEEMEADINGFFRTGVVTEWYDSRAGSWPADWVLRLHRAPVVSLDEVNYVDQDGTTQPFDLAKVEADFVSLPPRLRLLEAFPSLSDRLLSVSFKYTCQHMTMPEHAKDAVYRRCVEKYENRDLQDSMSVWQMSVRQLSWGVPDNVG